MMDPLPVWQIELDLLPPSAGPSWAPDFAGWAADRVSPSGALDGTGITPDPTALDISGSAPPYQFTFNKAVFGTNLLILPPTLDTLSGITGFAVAWELAVLASVAVVGQGSFIGSPAPPTLFSNVISTVIDPPSVLLGKAKIIELVGEPPPTGQPSKFPEKFREAFGLLTITVTGLDSTPTPTGPLPLVAAMVPLI